MAEKHKVVFPKCAVVPAEDQAAIQQQLLTYYKSLANHLLKAHKDLQNREKQNRQTLMVRILTYWHTSTLLILKQQKYIYGYDGTVGH